MLVGGEVLYGDAAFQTLARDPSSCEALDVCGSSKFVCVARPGGTATDKLGQSYAMTRTAILNGLQSYDDRNLTQWDFSPIADLYRCPSTRAIASSNAPVRSF